MRPVSFRLSILLACILIPLHASTARGAVLHVTAPRLGAAYEMRTVGTSLPTTGTSEFFKRSVVENFLARELDKVNALVKFMVSESRESIGTKTNEGSVSSPGPAAFSSNKNPHPAESNQLLYWLEPASETVTSMDKILTPPPISGEALTRPGPADSTAASPVLKEEDLLAVTENELILLFLDELAGGFLEMLLLRMPGLSSIVFDENGRLCSGTNSALTEWDLYTKTRRSSETSGPARDLPGTTFSRPRIGTPSTDPETTNYLLVGTALLGLYAFRRNP